MTDAGKIAFVDTEARRGLHYAGEFEFLHTDMQPPFRPARFMEAIEAAENAGAEVIILDSFSHEYDGVAGLIEWADELAANGVKSPGNWKEPKMAHRRLMNKLLQVRASIIFCLRADEKIAIERKEVEDRGQMRMKTVITSLGWVPICEKRFMYEMTASFTLTPDRPGIPHFNLPHKLQQQHRSMFSDQEPISEKAGRALRDWAHGQTSPARVNPSSPDGPAAVAPPDTKQDKPVSGGDGEDRIAQIDHALAEASKEGMVSLQDEWKSLAPADQKRLKAALDRVHKPRAQQVDAEHSTPAA